jgi:O-antigen ligase
MLTKLKYIYNSYSFYFPLLISFLIPFGINHGAIIIAWTICFLFFDDIKPKFKILLLNKWAIILLSFFFIHVIASFFSTNTAEALSSIEIKLCFFAFPILIFASRFNDLQIKQIAIAFVSGCFLSALFCLLRAVYLYYAEHFNAFFYSEFTYFSHPSYFSMHLIFAQLIVMRYYKRWLSHLSYLNVKIGLITSLFLVSIYLCSSKMGLITAFILIPSTLFMLLYSNGYKKTLLVLSGSFILIMLISYQLFPTPFERFKVALSVTSSSQEIDKAASESTAVRILIWEEAVKLIKQNWIFGLSPGDVNDALYHSYEESGLTGAMNKKLNAHNQFLQTFLGTGIVGFILLLLITIWLILLGFIKRNAMLLLFGILITLNFLVESMLQAQAGFVFFSFFVCFLLQYDLSKLKAVGDK